MVLRPDPDVGEDGVESRFELRIFEFMDVKGVGTGFCPHLGVIRLVGRGDEQDAPRIQDAFRFGEQIGPAFEVLDDFEGGDQVESPVVRTGAFRRSLKETRVGEMGAGPASASKETSIPMPAVP